VAEGARSEDGARGPVQAGGRAGGREGGAGRGPGGGAGRLVFLAGQWLSLAVGYVYGYMHVASSSP
jgi:hypothetical protein